MFQAGRSCLGSERCFGREVVVEAAMGEACGLHQIGHADAVEATLTEQAASRLDDALAIICGLILSQFHCASPEDEFPVCHYNDLDHHTLKRLRSSVIIELRSSGHRWASCFNG